MSLELVCSTENVKKEAVKATVNMSLQFTQVYPYSNEQCCLLPSLGAFFSATTPENNLAYIRTVCTMKKKQTIGPFLSKFFSQHLCVHNLYLKSNSHEVKFCSLEYDAFSSRANFKMYVFDVLKAVFCVFFFPWIQRQPFVSLSLYTLVVRLILSRNSPSHQMPKTF